MRIIWTDRRFFTFLAVASSFIALSPAFAQKGGTSGGSGGASGAGGAGSLGSLGSTGRGTVGPLPNSNLGSVYGNGNDSTGINTRSIFLSGRVMFDDGSQPSPDIRIERVCSGNPHLEAHTDSKGHFSFQVGQNPMVDTDAADESTGGLGRPNGQSASSPQAFGSNGNRTDPLWNCELRASYPGYMSDVVNLSNRRPLDDPDVGTMVLHRLAKVQGTTISVTSSLAPKRAEKDYEKALQSEQKGKLDEAEKHLLAATRAYPKYAVAWFALGQLQQREAKPDDARKSYEAAIAADNKYVSPYDQLALLTIEEGKWEEAANFSKQAIQLNPVEFPNDYWYNAVANYNSKKPGEAEKSALELVKVDTAHKYPEAEKMLAQILLDKREYSDAATHLRAYLALVPNAKNADSLKQVLLKIEQANAQARQ
ncbi:MAG: tetratricopeptide repeat protein [Bryobacteraceae bacterium]